MPTTDDQVRPWKKKHHGATFFRSPHGNLLLLCMLSLDECEGAFGVAWVAPFFAVKGFRITRVGARRNVGIEGRKFPAGIIFGSWAGDPPIPFPSAGILSLVKDHDNLPILF